MNVRACSRLGYVSNHVWPFFIFYFMKRHSCLSTRFNGPVFGENYLITAKKLLRKCYILWKWCSEITKQPQRKQNFTMTMLNNFTFTGRQVCTEELTSGTKSEKYFSGSSLLSVFYFEGFHLIWFSFWAVHKVRHAIFGQFLSPPPVTLRHTFRDPPKVRHTSRTPDFQKAQYKKPGQKPLVQILSQLLAGVLSGGLLSGRFCLGWFMSVPVLSEYICYIRKLNITLNFMFRILYDNFF